MSDNFITIEQAWYNELIRTKAKWDLFMDNCIHKDYPAYSTEEVNDWVNDYYFQIGIKPPESTIKSNINDTYTITTLN